MPRYPNSSKLIRDIQGAGVSIEAGIPSFRGSGSIDEDFQGKPLREIMSARIRVVGRLFRLISIGVDGL